MSDLKLYTVADLKNWLIHNNSPAGLSEHVIAPTRAWAIVNNPYVKDDDHVVAAIFDDGELAAFTAAFPEKMDSRRIWWFSTLYCFPQFEGKGYGLVAVGSLAEEYGFDNCFDRWGASETVAIFTALGHHTIYSHRYVLGDKVISTSSCKGKLLYALQACSKSVHRFVQSMFAHNQNSHTSYTLHYLPSIDDATYQFMQVHRDNNVFLHTQEMMNWEVRYPFTQTSPLMERVKRDTQFSSTVRNAQYLIVQVLNKEQLSGVYILKVGDSALNVVYLYYEEEAENMVFASILDHVRYFHVSHLETENETLASYISRNYYFPKYTINSISFSYPPSFENTLNNPSFQFGDGDSFA